MRKISISTVFIFICLFQGLLAQQKSDSVSVSLSELQVNANRAKLYSEMGRILTIIDKTEISRSAVQSIDQLLDYVAGVDIRQRGTNTTQADISVRGGSFDQVLVLLNGVNITDPQTGHFNLDIPLNLSDVSRVEILQGSSARVLGPNAFSGAINIVTESNDKQALKAELTAGSFNIFGQSVSGSISSDKLHTFASVSHKSSAGYMTNTDFDLSSAFVQSVLKTKDAGKFDLQLAGQLKDFGENGFYSLKYPNQREANKALFTALDWSLSNGNFSYNAQASWKRHYDRYELNHGAVAGYKYHLTDVTGGKLSGSYKSRLGKTTLGLNVRNEHIFSNSLGIAMSTPDSVLNPFESNFYFKKSYNRTVYSGMIDHSVSVGKWYFSAGIATSYSEDFKSTTYGGFDIAYSVTDDAKVYASANSASRLPTFTDLFFSNPAQQGNPALKPEQSKTIEFGTKMNQKNWSLNADVFYRKGENVIDWVKLNSSSAKYEAMNLSSVNALGGDFTFDYRFVNLFVKRAAFSYSYLNLDKAAVGFDSKYALDYLKHKVTLSVDHSIFKKLSASWRFGYFDRSGSYDANTVIGSPAKLTNYSPYTNLDCRLLWNDKHFDVFGDVNNIFNTKYADYGGLTQPGINFNVGVRLKL
ncbi:MAG: TonB-dependent receptor [Paludibacter sp.]|nr:TonB-dependent receptor [Paludibacter sp.]